MVPQMALIRGNRGVNIRFYLRDPEKAHILARNGVFWRILRQNPPQETPQYRPT